MRKLLQWFGFIRNKSNVVVESKTEYRIDFKMRWKHYYEDYYELQYSINGGKNYDSVNIAKPRINDHYGPYWGVYISNNPQPNSHSYKNILELIKQAKENMRQYQLEHENIKYRKIIIE